MRPKEIISIGEAARILKITPATLRSWEKKKKIKAMRVGGRFRVYFKSEIKALATKII